ncbi:MAG TPA: hypothetical protein VJN48_01000 [Terriglobales bacterium]|nr:hypothetical protein [Terriglobales bacterium]
MGGFVVDIFVFYLIRTLHRAWTKRGTSTWELKQAKVVSISTSPPAYGCPVAEVVYSYTLVDRTFRGSDDIPFVWRGSADEYVRKHLPESVLDVRVNPEEPEISIVNK